MQKMERIGIANCPKCGDIELFDVAQLVIYMPEGIRKPHASICCTKCKETFIASLNWKSAYTFDEMGCKVVGFSKRTAGKIKHAEIREFMKDFDTYLERFLTIVYSEEEGLFGEDSD